MVRVEVFGKVLDKDSTGKSREKDFFRKLELPIGDIINGYKEVGDEIEHDAVVRSRDVLILLKRYFHMEMGVKLLNIQDIKVIVYFNGMVSDPITIKNLAPIYLDGIVLDVELRDVATAAPKIPKELNINSKPLSDAEIRNQRWEEKKKRLAESRRRYKEQLEEDIRADEKLPEKKKRAIGERAEQAAFSQFSGRRS